MPWSRISRISATVAGVAVAAALLIEGAAAQSAAPAETADTPNQSVTTTTTTTANGAPGPGTTTPIRPVSLHAGPNSGAPVIGTLRPGMQLRVVATGSYGWTQVELPSGTGWAYGPGYLAGVTSASAGEAQGNHGPIPEIISP